MQSLYRKYRPLKFADVQGQSHIVETLTNALTSDHIAHAYLFTGSRGTGKTTMARLLASALNCQKRNPSTDSARTSSEPQPNSSPQAGSGQAKKKGAEPVRQAQGEPCGKCENCLATTGGSSLAVQEIDAASHTGVDNIRELRREMRLPPTPGNTYKIYIIDEVHMLSAGAWGALLKTLEEPPSHAIFILATTEIQKVPETIISRCQRFDFSRLPIQNIIDKLTRIAKSEKVEVESAVLEMVAIAAEGGMRDAESLLSQLISLEDKKITAKEAETLLGFSNRRHVTELIHNLVLNDLEKSLQAIQTITDAGHDMEYFTVSLLHAFRRLLLLRVAPQTASALIYELTDKETHSYKEYTKKVSPSWIIRGTELFLVAKNTLGSSPIPQLPLEIAVVKLIGDDAQSMNNESRIVNSGGENKESRIENVDKNTGTQSKKSKNSQFNQEHNSQFTIHNASEQKITKLSKTKNSTKKKDLTIDMVKSIWPELLKRVRNEKSAIAMSMRSATPYEVTENTVKIATKFPIYKDTLNQKENRLTIASLLGTILETKINIVVETAKNAGVEVKTQKVASDENHTPLLADVLETFGDTVAT